MLALLTGLMLGAAHVMAGPDHLTAIASLPARTKAWRTGAIWGLGHAAGIGLVGLLLWLVGGALDLERLGAWGETVVGIALIAAGAWALLRPVHDPKQSAGARGPAFVIGAIHGVAGGSHLHAVLPTIALEDGGVYLAGFALGAVLAMAIFSAIYGRVLAQRSASTRARIQTIIGLASCALGVAWLLV